MVVVNVCRMLAKMTGHARARIVRRVAPFLPESSRLRVAVGPPGYDPMPLPEGTAAVMRASPRCLTVAEGLLANQLNKDVPLPRLVVQIDEDDLLPGPQNRSARVEGD